MPQSRAPLVTAAYLQLAVLVATWEIILIRASPWIAVVPIAVTFFVWLAFGGKEPLLSFIKKVRDAFALRIRQSYLLAVTTNLALIVSLCITTLVCHGLYLETRKADELARYKQALVLMSSNSIAARIEGSRAINEVFVNTRQPSLLLHGLLITCEDVNPDVRGLSRRSLQSSAFSNESLTLEFERSIYERLKDLRVSYCTPSGLYTPQGMEHLAQQMANLLTTFAIVSQRIKSPAFKTGLGHQQGYVHEMVYDSIDIIALTAFHQLIRRDISGEQAAIIFWGVNESKLSLRSEPFKEQYDFITDAEAQCKLQQARGDKLVFPTYYYHTRYRIGLFVPREDLDEVWRNALSKPDQ